MIDRAKVAFLYFALWAILSAGATVVLLLVNAAASL
jgi:hypothetical protein